mgnify:CR=1 FL=1
MFQIQNTLVTLDIVERFFCCDLEKCLGACCIEGDAGAPVTEAEVGEINRVLPEIERDMLPRAIDEVRDNGVAYRDPEGELVTTLLDGRNCAFSCYGPGGVCLCAIEKARREGRIDGFLKPISCSLYPLRVTEYKDFTAINYHRWEICRSAEQLGRRKGIRLYQFLKEPLIRRFGAEWYDELCANCELYLKEYPEGIAR